MVSKTYNVSDFDAIIYDLGAVIIDISYETTIKAFEALGIESFSTIFSKAQQSALTDNFETGHISETEFDKVFVLTPTKTPNTLHWQLDRLSSN